MFLANVIWKRTLVKLVSVLTHLGLVEACQMLTLVLVSQIDNTSSIDLSDWYSDTRSWLCSGLFGNVHSWFALHIGRKYFKTWHAVSIYRYSYLFWQILCLVSTVTQVTMKSTYEYSVIWKKRCYYHFFKIIRGTAIVPFQYFEITDCSFSLIGPLNNII